MVIAQENCEHSVVTTILFFMLRKVSGTMERHRKIGTYPQKQTTFLKK